MRVQRGGLFGVPLSLHRPRRRAPAVDGFAAPTIPYAQSHKDVRPTTKYRQF